MAGNKKLVDGLNQALEREMSNVISYLHYSLMVRGVNRGPLVDFFRGQAQESFGHATKLGEKIVALGGKPSLKVEPIKVLRVGSPEVMLREELKREQNEVEEYKKLLKLVAEDDIALRFMLEEIVKEEQEGIEELAKRLA